MRGISAYVPNTAVLLDTRYFNAEDDPEETVKSEEKRFGCFVCDKRYTFRATLQAHMRAHVEEDFVCPVEGCNLIFKRRKLLTRHKRMAHTVKKKCYCPEPGCGDWFWHKHDLTRHHNDWHQEKPQKALHVCPIADCKKEYKRFGHFKLHMSDVHRLQLPDPPQPAKTSTTANEDEVVIHSF